MTDEPLETAEAAAKEEQLDAVVIIKTTTGDGTIVADPVPHGNIQATEVQTLIEMGLKRWREKIGLS